MAILSFFIILLLVAFPLGSFSRVTPWLTVSFSLLDVVVAIGSIVWLVNKLRLKQKPNSLQSKAFVGIVGIFILSLLINIPHLSIMQLVPSALYIVRFALYGILFFIVAESHAARKQKIHFLLLGGGSLLLLGGYMQLFLFPSLKGLTYFGWDEHFYRMFGTFLDPNFFGLFLALFFLYTIAQLFRLKIQQKRWTFALYFVLSTAIFIAIFLPYKPDKR